jgi:hypothetical protein
LISSTNILIRPLCVVTACIATFTWSTFL